MEHSGVRGLVLPARLSALMREGRWRHPGDAELTKLIPWFEDPLDFLTSAEQMRRESRSLDRLADDPRLRELFRTVRGSSCPAAVDLPWLDTEQAILIAVNRRAGDDVALALDYRAGAVDPRVVGSDCWTSSRECAWRVVAPAFSSFADALGL
ncbi:hypothetical protein [Streptomyces sp. S.PB5]|uniref:hypothetical protein n=1 Tax=Streptomyces sp. S.PB5 TaxID=3020844 RepID=UPI0025AF673A|nr:hypothetical protein [Streptomyces sp. S.PB5]MDN3029485.1 hypothetical protein [Streptomyces sp. S.PB5]